MVKEELNKRSPLRVFEQSIHGGVGKGNLGVLVSRKGVGKTACLVHIATDKLFRGEHVIHVSFSQNVNHVMAWYEDIFNEISKRRHLDNAMDIHDEIIKNRVIMNFNQENVSVKQILTSLQAMIEQGGFSADAVMFDGYRIGTGHGEDIGIIKEFARKMNLEVWFSLSPLSDEAEYDAYGVPSTIEKIKDTIDVLIGLVFDGEHVAFTVVKDHDETKKEKIAVKLDPKTMLISESV
ncbi:MAG: hypothetical protein K9K78_07875 [Spirochaetales bacterium]|nr:hypothetical protein [Spirochaetales bacterium]